MNLHSVFAEPLSLNSPTDGLTGELVQTMTAISGDAGRLDCYWRAVIAGVERTSPCVVNVEVHQRARRRVRAGEPRERRGFPEEAG